MYKWANVLSRESLHVKNHTHKKIVSSKILEVLEKKKFQDRYLESPTDISCISKANEVAITTNGRHSACVDMGWVYKHRKHCVALYANFDLDQRAHVIPSQPKCRQGLGPNGLLPHTILRAMWPQRHCRRREGFHARYIFHHSSVFFYQPKR